MGAIADGIVAYAQPLIDQTDGSFEEMNKALAITQFCFNLALTPEDRREKMLSEIQKALEMDDEKFDAFRRSIVVPMIQRHEEMFPLMHRRPSANAFDIDRSPQEHPRMAAPAEKRTVIDRYSPCPCGSGEKYKFCCGKKGR